jgi:hypothetical protein
MNQNIYYRIALTVAFLIFFGQSARSQTNFFDPLPASKLREDITANQHIRKLAFYKLKTNQLRQYLANAPLEFTRQTAPVVLEMPLPNGQNETFELYESPILAPDIAALHPEIKTYAGRSKTHREYTIRISFTPEGFNAIILGIGNDAAYYDKVSNDKSDEVYRVYFASDAERPKPDKDLNQGSKCGVIDLPFKETFPEGMPNRGRLEAGPNDVGGVRRVFRLAMAANKEFVDATQGGSGNVNTAFNVLLAYVNRINAVYQKELNVTLLLVSGTNVISTNQADYDNNSQSTMLGQNQTLLDNLLGNGNYDIGHVLGYAGSSGGGIASRPSVCDNASKAQGVSGVGDGSFAAVFDDQLIAHEMGHQFNMSHSYNSIIPVCTTREPSTSVEPGSGTTIMSYGYTCYSDSNPGENDDYEAPYQPFLNFHTVNYEQAATFIATTATCFTTTSTGNSTPTITAKTSNMTIPKSTPFALTGTATDIDGGDAITYSWEGTNIGTEVPTMTTLTDPSKAPFFRSYEPVTSGTRTFPRLSAILDGTNVARGDKLPTVGVATTHRLTVRDNAGGVTYGEVTVTVDGNSGPFLETTNLAGTYTGNSAQTITWSVNGTTAAPVSCANVNILLSTDGGVTFPTTLLANTPNDGAQTVMLPNITTSTARIKVEAVGNIFFDISNSNFTITEVVISNPPTVANLSANPNPVCAGQEVTFTATVGNTSGDYTYELTNGAGSTQVGTVSGSTFSQSLTAMGTGLQSYTLTITNANGSGNATSFLTVNAAPTPPMLVANPSTTTQSQPITVTASGCSGTVNWTVGGGMGVANGNQYLFTTPGSYTVSATCTQNGCISSASAALSITIGSPPPTGSFQITGVSNVSCAPVAGEAARNLTFTPIYSGGDSSPIQFDVQAEMLPTTAAGPYTIKLYLDNPTITLRAVQGSVTSTFAYTWQPTCNDGPPPPAGVFAITGVSGVSCTPVVGEAARTLTFTPAYSGTDSSPIQFDVQAEMLPTTAAGPYTIKLYLDNPIITLRAVQGGVTSTFAFTWQPACNPSSLRLAIEEKWGLPGQLKAYPNPVRDAVTIEVLSPAAGKATFEVLDVAGQVRQMRSENLNEGMNEVDFRLGKLPSGIYIIRIMDPLNRQKAIRIIKQ